MMSSTLLLTSLLASFVAQEPVTFDPSWRLEIATPTYGADGTRTGASMTIGAGQLTLGQPVVLYPYSGETLCHSSSAGRDEPTGAGYGWRVQLVPVKYESGLVVSVEWQRMWFRGQRVSDGPRGTAQITFKPGTPIVFDHITDAPSSRCKAIGMSLEIGLEPRDRNELVEASLWLIRPLPGGGEQVQHQVLRLRPGTSVDYYFDDIALSVNGSRTNVRTTGRLTLVDVVRGQAEMDVAVGQYVMTDATRPGQGGSSGFRLTVKPAEVVSIQVPKITTDADRMSLRLQVRQMR